MASTELLLLGVLRALVEVAMLALLGQGVVGLFAGSRRQANPIYVLFRIITGPATRTTRWITPKAIVDEHIPYVTFFLLFWLWLFLAWAKRVLAQ